MAERRKQFVSRSDRWKTPTEEAKSTRGHPHVSGHGSVGDGKGRRMWGGGKGEATAQEETTEPGASSSVQIPSEVVALRPTVLLWLPETYDGMMAHVFDGQTEQQKQLKKCLETMVLQTRFGEPVCDYDGVSIL